MIKLTETYADELVFRDENNTRIVYYNVNRSTFRILFMAVYQHYNTTGLHKSNPKCQKCAKPLFLYDGIVICEKCREIQEIF